MRILFLLVFLQQGYVCLTAYTYSDAKNTRFAILTDFDAHARPTDNTEVKVSLSLVSINSLDPKEQALSATGWFTVAWSGATGWNVGAFNVDILHFFEGEIWRPDLVIENSVDDVGPVVEEQLHYRASPDGVTVWEPQVKFKVHCAMDVTYFPFDRHRCSLVLSSWAYIASELSLSALGTKVNLDHYIENAEWELLSTDPEVEVGNETRVVNTETRTYSKLTFYFELERRRDIYGLLIFLPLVLISILSTLVFVLPVETGQKAGYCVAILLAAILLFTVYYDHLPAGRYLPIIVVYVMMVFILVTTCITCSVVVLYMHHHDTQKSLSPFMVSLGLFLMQITCSKKTDKNTDTDDSWQVHQEPEPAEGTRNNVPLTSNSLEHLSNGNALAGQTLPRRKLTPIERNRVRPRSDTSIRRNISLKSASFETETFIDPITWNGMAKHFNKLCLITHILLSFLVHFVLLVTLGVGGTTT